MIVKSLNCTTLPEKAEFYSNLNMEEITGTDYRHGKSVYKYFKKRKEQLGEHHDLYF